MLRKLIMYLRLFLSNEWEKANIYNKYLGVKFGKSVRISSFPSFGSEPYLIEIGNNVTITRGVAFVNHDGGAAVFRNEYPGLNVFGKIKIENNVFIGKHSIIFPSVNIGNNVVIGAGSLVTKDIPDNTVAAGVPAKFIKSFTDYKETVLKKSIQIHSKGEQRKKEILEFLNKS